MIAYRNEFSALTEGNIYANHRRRKYLKARARFDGRIGVVRSNPSMHKTLEMNKHDYNTYSPYALPGPTRDQLYVHGETRYN